MYRNKKIFCIILARKNSVGIKNKNLQKIKGKPLIWYPIKAASKSKYIDKIIFNTDSLKMANYAKNIGAKIDFLRPKHLAKSSSHSSDAIIHHIKKMNLEESYDYFILLEPTSPLTSTNDIDASIKKLINNKKASSLLAVTDHSIPNKNYKVNFKKNFLNIKKNIFKERRQDYKNVYYITGALYLSKVQEYLKYKTFFQKNVLT